MPEDKGQDQEMSVQRKAAEMLLDKAREELERGRHEQAIGFARDALQEDPSHLQIRHWLARLYEDNDELVRASREYQEIIHADGEDQDAWAGLRRVDGPAVERLTRLQDIAEDPFLHKRQDDIDDDLFTTIGDEEDEEEDEEEYEEAPDLSDAEELPLEAIAPASEAQEEDEELSLDPAEETADEAPQLSADEPELTLDEPEVGAEQPTVAEEDAAQEEAAPSPTAVPQGPPWVHEQEAEFRQRLLARPNISPILQTLEDMTQDVDAWEPVVNKCVHMDRERHAGVAQTFDQLSEFFGVECPQLFMAAERRMVPSFFGHDPLSVSVTTGMLSAYTEVELRFAVGRVLAHLVIEDRDCPNVRITILQRTPTSATDVEEALVALLDRKCAGWDIGVPREEMIMTRKIAHAWEQRVVLSCDRGGLLACGDFDAACLAIAKATARTADEAEKMTLDEFVAEYRDQDPRQLAAIDEKQCPLRSGPYSAYRILMLKWWAGTEQYAQLSGA